MFDKYAPLSYISLAKSPQHILQVETPNILMKGVPVAEAKSSPSDDITNTGSDINSDITAQNMVENLGCKDSEKSKISTPNNLPMKIMFAGASPPSSKDKIVLRDGRTIYHTHHCHES
jgi:hypothetical protein